MSKKQINEAVITSAVRTPIGKFGESLKDFTPAQLGTIVIKDVMKRSCIIQDEIEEVVIGNVLSAGHGQNVARQCAIGADIPVEVPSYTVNKVCGSGLKSVILGAQSIMLGDANIVIAGGTESMSQAPYVLKKTRWGLKMGNGEIIDSMISDGLWDVFNNYHMGVTAENIAQKYNVTREEQDEFATNSQNKTEIAMKDGKFDEEIVPITVPTPKGDPIIIRNDEFPRFGTKKETLAKLRPAFKKDGTVTAGNSSGINDGAAAVILMSKNKAEEKIDEESIDVLATIEGYAYCGVSPDIMGMGPVNAIRKAVTNASIDLSEIDIIELNEAFASQSIAVTRELELDINKVNVNGGAIALGHPIGASGTRILTTLAYELTRRDETYGLAALCIGGGQGIAMVIRNYNG